MLYQVARPIARLGLRVFLRKIQLAHAERIPWGKPIILAVNHPTGFMEPSILAVFLQGPIFFLVRGDFFQNPLANFMLRALHMVPIFRMRDGGINGLKTNYSTFAACHAALAANKSIMIFPEGLTEHEKRLRPLQRGLGRIAFGVLDAYPDLEDVYVVPIGVTFTYADRFRSSVMMSVGEPIGARAFYGTGEQPDGQGLTETLADRLRAEMVIIEDPADDELADYLWIMDRSTRPEPVFPIFSTQEKALRAEQAIAQQVNQMGAEEKAALRQVADAYFQRLAELQISDAAVYGGNSAAMAGLERAAGGMLAGIGRVFCYPPARLAQWIKDTKVESVTFYGPILWAAGLGAFLVYFIGWAVVSLLTGAWWLLMGALLLGCLGFYSLLYREKVAVVIASERWNKLSAAQQTELRQLRESVMAGILINVEGSM
ncbi:MAG: 1-acyl-sn-glycerol-3-phosphate acyltransferase [Lewinellaceae bacterium]|nr:1-acyl-sn-glycerol-3-phosphate acyltransferase [Lewinellaceae bacterium]